MKMAFTHRVSKLYIPLGIDSASTIEKVTSTSHRLLAGEGLVRSQSGLNSILPLMMRSVNKLQSLVHRHMETISAQEISLPVLTPSNLFEKTGRINSTELFKLKDRQNKEFVLSPTHEEAITDLLANGTVSHNKLPLKLYQISKKFRDEKRPKSGLLRSREFVMKDLYCFDDSVESRENTYKEVFDCYNRFFKSLNVPYVVVNGDAGDIGEGICHEFHYITEAGDDHLLMCKDCGWGVNPVEAENVLTCEKCKSENLIKQRGIEVGHTFHLGQKYSKPLKGQFTNLEGKLSLLEMSCYGLGITRIIAGAVEVLSKPKQIRWPLQIAPFSVYFIPPKENSKEDIAGKNSINHVCSVLNENFKSDVLVDDRTDTTIGKRLQYGKSLGIPYIFIIGKKIKDEIPKVEVQNLCNESVSDISVSELNDFIKYELINKEKNVDEPISNKAVG